MTHTTSITVVHEGTESDAAQFAAHIYEFVKGHAGFKKIALSTVRQFYVPGINSNGETPASQLDSAVRDTRG